MSPTNVSELLARTEIFRHLDESVLTQLGDSADKRSYKKGAVIFTEGDPGETLLVLVDGLVKVYVMSEDGDEMVLTTLRSPEVFGELALLDGGARSASAEALERTTVLSVARGSLLSLLHERPTLADSLLHSLGAVIRRLTEQASDLVFLDLHGRVAKLLLTLAAERGEKHGQDTVLDLQVTQTDLAGMVGGSRQSVNQILHSLQARGYIELRGRTVVIKHPEQLRRRAGIV